MLIQSIRVLPGKVMCPPTHRKTCGMGITGSSALLESVQQPHLSFTSGVDFYPCSVPILFLTISNAPL